MNRVLLLVPLLLLVGCSNPETVALQQAGFERECLETRLANSRYGGTYEICVETTWVCPDTICPPYADVVRPFRNFPPR